MPYSIRMTRRSGVFTTITLYRIPMSESNNRRKLAVGIFIFVGLVILLTGVIVIGGQHKAFVKSIRLQVVFDDVQGLQTGNNVWLSGMKGGAVKKVAFY